jgi:uncharacterized protein (DUF924 family)
VAIDRVSTAQQEILHFWFGDLQTASYQQQRKLWFRKKHAVDQEIRDRFQTLYQQAATAKLDSWQQTPVGCLALILLLDQFSRHMFRNTPQAFAMDAKALSLAKWAIAQGFDRQLHPLQRIFIYLPLEHSENLEDQRQSVKHFQQLSDSHSDLQDVLDSALRHQIVIERFGRFPHRNPILGRVSTPEEAEFLKQPGARF